MELQATRKIANRVGLDCVEAELPFLETARDIRSRDPSALGKVVIPEGYIPARNMVFYASAAYYAEVYGADYIVGGHLETDCVGFPDATASFFSAVEGLINMARLQDGRNGTHVGDGPVADGRHSGDGVRLLLPFLRFGKSDVLRLAIELDVPLQLTWTCYLDRETQCGSCAACLERKQAFDSVGFVDPIRCRPATKE
jgi:7-cyano-7-deazaguanine synthase